MAISDIFRINELKANLAQIQEERDSLKKELADYQQVRKQRDALKKLVPETDIYRQLKSSISLLEKRKIEIAQQVKSLESKFEERKLELNLTYKQQEQELKQQLRNLNKQISDKKDELIILEDSILLQSFGFYTPKYDFENSEIYRIKLEQIRNQQEATVKSGEAAYCTTSWSVNTSEKEGKRMIKDYVKLILRSFNNECDASILRVKLRL